MATFPSIEAIEISYNMASVTCSLTSNSAGHPVVYRHGDYHTNVTITYKFPFCTLAQAETISNHYRTEKLKKFELPSSLWLLHPNKYEVVPANNLFMYASPPSRSRTGDGLVDVQVAFRSVLAQ